MEQQQSVQKIQADMVKFRKDMLLKSGVNITDQSILYNLELTIEKTAKTMEMLKRIQSEGIGKTNPQSTSSTGNEPTVVKSLMFSWQLMNHLMLNRDLVITRGFIEKLINQHGQFLTELVSFTFKMKINSRIKYHESTTKCMLIFLYNYFYRLQEFMNIQEQILKQVSEQQTEVRILCDELIIGSFINLIQLQQIHKKQKTFLIPEQQEWSLYLFHLVLNMTGAIRAICKFFRSQPQDNDNNLYIEFFHTLASLVTETIEARTTTELVKGFPSQLSEIKLMYTSKTEKPLRVCLPCPDYVYLCQLFKEETKKYIKFIEGRVDKEKVNIEEKEIKQKQQSQLLMLLLDILGQISFLGGYNISLQELTSPLVMESCLNLLEINYLLYILTENPIRNIKIAPSQFKPGTFIKEVRLSLQKLLNKNNQLQKVQIIQEAKLVKMNPIPEGILPLILKLLSNLVHINREAQKYLQNETKYFHIVLALTHNVPSQMTMREWAIVFIRHASECSPKMRQIIQNSKIDINVKPDAKNNPFFHTVDM